MTDTDNSIQPERQPVDDLLRQLQERAKELNCLYGISEIVERADGSLDRILQDIVELLPMSWTHVDVACARILLDEGDVRSKRYGEVVSTQRADIRV